jgi:7,8-dihydro-6-hydroxymethylpterin-pyrophosphokinase
VLTPLTEIAPHVLHPGLNQTAAELLQNLEDRSLVKRWQP